MSEEEKLVAEATPEVTPGTETTPSVDDNNQTPIDYEKEFDEQVSRFEKSQHNREGFERRKAKAKVDESVDESNVDSTIDQKVQEALRRIVPTLQKSIAEEQVETIAAELSQNPAEKRLILFHFENSVGTHGTIRERLENAKLIANKKTFLKRQGELALALNNRSQAIGLGSGAGSNSDVQSPSDNVLSKDQINDLKKRGWDDRKIATFKANLLKRV